LVWRFIKLPSKSSNDKSSTGNIALIYHPTHHDSHHQDYYIFTWKSPSKPSFATCDGILGWGKSKKYVPENERLEPKNHPMEKLQSNIIF